MDVMFFLFILSPIFFLGLGLGFGASQAFIETITYVICVLIQEPSLREHAYFR